MTESWDNKMSPARGQSAPKGKGRHIFSAFTLNLQKNFEIFFFFPWGLGTQRRQTGSPAFFPGWWTPNCFSCFAPANTASWSLCLTTCASIQPTLFPGVHWVTVRPLSWPETYSSDRLHLYPAQVLMSAWVRLDLSHLLEFDLWL